MSTKHNRTTRKRHNNRTKKNGGKHKKKWTTAIDAAQATLKTTGSLAKARASLRSQALINARKLFGTVGSAI
jgi:hypothetical protein